MTNAFLPFFRKKKFTPLLWRGVGGGAKKTSLKILGSFFILACLAPLIANEKPLLVKKDDKLFLPLFGFNNDYPSNTDWKSISCDWKIYTLIPYSPGKNDYAHANYVSPFGEQELPLQQRHWLGTNRLGADVLSGIIHGARISLFTGTASMIVAGIIGIFLGTIAGYFGNHRIQLKRGTLLFIIIGIILAFFYATHIPGFFFPGHSSAFAVLLKIISGILIFFFIIILFHRLGKLFSQLRFLKSDLHFPADGLVLRVIEIFSSVPVLIIILGLAAVSEPSLFNVILIIGFTFWTDIARIVRAEMLRLRSAEFIVAAEALGLKSWRIIFRHALPNCMTSVLVYLSFGAASAIMVESALSFLGIGLPAETVSWGTLLAEGKENLSAWWLVVFPGMMIFLTVWSLNSLADELSVNPSSNKKPGSMTRV